MPAENKLAFARSLNRRIMLLFRVKGERLESGGGGRGLPLDNGFHPHP